MSRILVNANLCSCLTATLWGGGSISPPPYHFDSGDTKEALPGLLGGQVLFLVVLSLFCFRVFRCILHAARQCYSE